MGLKDDNAKLRKQLDGRNIEYEHMCLRIGELESLTRSQYEQIETLQAELATVRTDNKLLGQSIGKADERLRQVQRESDVRYANLQKAEKQVDLLHNQNSSLINTEEDLSTSISDLTASIRMLVCK